MNFSGLLSSELIIVRLPLRRALASALARSIAMICRQAAVPVGARRPRGYIAINAVSMAQALGNACAGCKSANELACSTIIRRRWRHDVLRNRRLPVHRSDPWGRERPESASSTSGSATGSGEVGHQHRETLRCEKAARGRRRARACGSAPERSFLGKAAAHRLHGAEIRRGRLHGSAAGSSPRRWEEGFVRLSGLVALRKPAAGTIVFGEEMAKPAAQRRTATGYQTPRQPGHSRRQTICRRQQESDEALRARAYDEVRRKIRRCIRQPIGTVVEPGECQPRAAEMSISVRQSRSPDDGRARSQNRACRS